MRARAPRARQLLPRAPGVVHGARGRRAGGSRRSRAARAAPGRRPQRPGRALHAGLARPPTAIASRSSASLVARARGRRPRGVAGVLRGPGGGRRDDHRDRGRLPARGRRRARRRPPRGRAPTSRPCAATRPRSCGPRRRACSPGSPPAGAPTPGRWRSCRATTSRATARSCARVVEDAGRARRATPTGWTASVSFVTTMVDRITPRTGAGRRARRAARPPGATTAARRHRAVQGVGAERRLPGAGRPRWEDAGATFTDDVTPFEHRKLWLLNGAHSLLAYSGSIRGHTTVAEAVGDDTCRGLGRAVVGGGVAAPRPAGRGA